MAGGLAARPLPRSWGLSQTLGLSEQGMLPYCPLLCGVCSLLLGMHLGEQEVRYPSFLSLGVGGLKAPTKIPVLQIRQLRLGRAGPGLELGSLLWLPATSPSFTVDPHPALLSKNSPASWERQPSPFWKSV